MSNSIETRKRGPRSAFVGLAGALAAALVATAGVPIDAAAEQPEIVALDEAFKDYLKSVREMQKSFVMSSTFELDDAHAVGAYDLITAFMHSGLRNSLTSSGSGERGRPRFAGFDDPDTRIGVDNPDTQYMGTVVNNADGQGIWRVWGNRTNTADLIITAFDTASGQGGGDTVEDEDMDIAPDGSYEVYASTADLRDPAWGENWLELTAAPTLQIARRQSHCDWEVEAPGEVHIERMGTAGVPSGPLDPAIMTRQIENGTALNEVQAPFWPAFVDSIKDNIPVNTATPWRPTGGLGITTQLSMLMWFDIADDEALIIRLPDEDVAGYYGLQLSNFWGSSADWANRHASMSWGLGGSCQAEQSQPTFHPAQQAISDAGGSFCGQQDAYFIVVSKNDPGVQNWIETTELSQGILAGRLQSVNPAEVPDIVGLSCSLPVAIQVPTVAVKPTLQALGASFTPYGPVERADQLETRQDFVRNKYIFW
jgi:hypothetical protein